MKQENIDVGVAVFLLGVAGTGYGSAMSYNPVLDYFFTSVFVASSSMWLTFKLLITWDARSNGE